MGRNDKKDGWTRRFAGKCLALALASALFAAHAAADTRKPVVNPDPEYPEIARRMNLTGTVRVEIVIAADGTIKSARVMGGHPVLADAVQKALKKWKYAPGAAETTLQLEFKF
jgi:TonB family protein